MTRKMFALLAATATIAVAGPALALSIVHHMTDTLMASPMHYDGTCPGEITFHGKVHVTGQFQPGSTVEIGYQFSRSDGGTGQNKFFNVSHDGVYDVTDTWTLGGPPVPHYAGWEHFKTWVTDSAEGGGKGGPGIVWSDKASFSLVCKK
jgi:hypothetical protein